MANTPTVIIEDRHVNLWLARPPLVEPIADDALRILKPTAFLAGPRIGHYVIEERP